MPVSKVVLNDVVKLDLTEDTVTPETLSEGVTAHDKSGSPIVGTAQFGGGLSWVTVATSLPNAMYKFGDANLDGEITIDDAQYVMDYLGGSGTFTPVQMVVSDVEFSKNITYEDAMLIAYVANGKATLPFTYATAVEYPDALAGQDVKALFKVTINGTVMNAPTFAYVPWDGIIAIYSNVSIPQGATGQIQILK